MEDSFSNRFRLSPVKGCVTEDPAREIEAMASMYLEAAKVGGKREMSGRQRILDSMRDAFEQAGVLRSLCFQFRPRLTRSLAIHSSLILDIESKGEIKLFQAVSLKAGVDAAVSLAARYPRIAAGYVERWLGRRPR